MVIKAKSFSNIIFILNRTDISGSKVVKNNIKYRFGERKEKSTFTYSNKSEKEKYGANKLEAQTPCKR
ncbi:hypothetical protein CONCODRAFT_3610 [Conidiobolus coronatus NRRL 28638]|uniref:Uncharacterized protein n=1 Tax=Conidiobolus coronatus (strain ATCC 28846 / CBS 209.66 / NRRL 28638) TaxID=796925 RepID=A0A137PEG6_CONC2|nr:hypothetical protein CONCODRAFT_3610 [Conidiobolus coronatus NRRL 28638]|eukprot:KXN73380.1 hypothetical protein CONCODRAFT_3610 [Conidiobolus coronatus NRRL 28638]